MGSETPPPGTALITGASSGLGAEFARQLAARGHALILVARRADRLGALANELREQHGVAVEVLVADLSSPADTERVQARLRECDDLTLLINNAGFGTVGRFAEVELHKTVSMINVHVTAAARLAHAALPGMQRRRRGAIINVSSVAGFVPRAGSVNYGATKAFLTAFSEALHNEVAGTGVSVQALCPGFTYTEFHDTPEFRHDFRSAIPGFLWMNADAVVRISLEALPGGRAVVVPGWRNRALLALTRSRWLLGLMLRMRVRRHPAEDVA